jgi:hypothetical protein
MPEFVLPLFPALALLSFYYYCSTFVSPLHHFFSQAVLVFYLFSFHSHTRSLYLSLSFSFYLYVGTCLFTYTGSVCLLLSLGICS